MKRDRGLINFDCSKGAMEHNGEWGGGGGGLTVRLHYIICRKSRVLTSTKPM